MKNSKKVFIGGIVFGAFLGSIVTAIALQTWFYYLLINQ